VQNDDCVAAVLEDNDRRIGMLVRAALLMIAVGLASVFAIAIYLNPYRDGRVWHEGTHQQLGLQPCTFKVWTGYPCPSCGMTSSFALLMRGDVWNSIQANGVGTMLALFCLLMIPWSVACVIRGRIVFFDNAEMLFVKLLVCFFVLLLLRWLMVMAFELRLI